MRRPGLSNKIKNSTTRGESKQILFFTLRIADVFCFVKE